MYVIDYFHPISTISPHTVCKWANNNTIELFRPVPDQTDVESSNGSIQNGHANGNSKSHRLTSSRIPSVNVIAESSADGQIIRSHSVGHSMAVVSTKSPGDSKYLLNVTTHHNGLKNGIKSEGMRYTLSQPLLANTSADSHNKSLRESHKHWRSGTLSRPDIFYQVQCRKWHLSHRLEYLRIY